MNYAPSTAAQTRMWSDWDPDTVSRDFARITALNANTVRLFVYVPVSGYPYPSSEYLKALHEALDIAESHCLRVQLTLFAFFNSFNDVAGSKHWLRAVLEEFSDDPRLALIELYNELDTRNQRALDWARQLLPYAQSLSGEVPVTISVSGEDPVGGLERLKAAGLEPDFFDLHYYGLPELAFATFRRAAAVAGSKPLFVGETGYSSLDRSGTEDASWWSCYQAHYLITVAVAANALRLPPVAPWTFTDFVQEAFPKGSKSAENPGEYHYGLEDIEGQPKPAATAIRALFAGNTPVSVPNASFEDGDDSADCWLAWQPAAARFARDTTTARSGTASVRLSESTSTKDGSPAFYVSPAAVIVPGQTYVATAWARGKLTTGTTSISLAWFDANSRFLGAVSSLPLAAGDTVWTQLAVTSVAPTSASFVQVHLVSADNRGSVWFDDVSFN